MNFNVIRLSGEGFRLYLKFLLVMKLTMILLIAALMQVNAAGYAQKITLIKNDATLIQVLKQIRQQSGYNFVYNQKSLKNAKKVDINITNADIKEALSICFAGQPLTYEVLMNTVVIKDVAALKKINGVVNVLYWLGKPAVVKEQEIHMIKDFLCNLCLDLNLFFKLDMLLLL